MSSMRNAVQRRSHRERAQPLERKRFGLLEKDKDRQLRQKDYKKKSATLKSLREKAADRNEDEFYFGMLSRDGPGSRVLDGKKWRGTVTGDRGNRAMEVSLVRLLKTQDIAYVRTTRSVVMREVQRLTEAVVLAAEGLPAGDDEDEEGDDEFDFAEVPKPKKIVFVDDVAQQLEAVEEEEEEVGGADDSDGLDDEDDDDEKEEAVDEETARKTKNLQRLRAELALAQRKLKVLTKAEQELEIQQAKMAKTATSGGTTRKGKKIMVRTRKR
ncbi:Small subunit (SSU) processome component [Verticillium nonalfalfae]|uniref:U3 small nucleolar RNA-associated protein 11 n=1 Tax=Verticillium nonalfalfae TaxID=1051616 RepID=A0A3M9XX10_9PEZI|nr:Small subunit (SSU) processome component [Verticillium nonalfalfae]RNJ52435.1 Small subunit (SSU) processome component [Verticillium nonalfalfae]